MLFGHLAREDESADARRILTAVPQSDWKRLADFAPAKSATSWWQTLHLTPPGWVENRHDTRRKPSGKPRYSIMTRGLPRMFRLGGEPLLNVKFVSLSTDHTASANNKPQIYQRSQTTTLAYHHPFLKYY